MGDGGKTAGGAGAGSTGSALDGIEPRILGRRRSMEGTKGLQVAQLNQLAGEARMLTQSLMVNWLQLGKVLTQAKELVQHGEWGSWLRENAPVGERAAQNMMRAWQRFGSNPACLTFKGSHLTAMLQLPEGTEETFLQENDLSDMTARQVQEAVKKAVQKAREQAEALLEDERQKTQDAERRIKTLEAEQRIKARGDKPSPIPEDVLREMEDLRRENEQMAGEVARLSETAQAAMKEKLDAVSRLAQMQSRMETQGKLLEDREEAARKAESQYLELVSRRGQDGSGGDGLSAEEFASATRVFLGTCGVLPFMGARLCEMDGKTRQVFREHLESLDSFLRGAWEAMGHVLGEVIET